MILSGMEKNPQKNTQWIGISRIPGKEDTRQTSKMIVLEEAVKCGKNRSEVKRLAENKVK
jgi:hypothetical protein